MFIGFAVVTTLLLLLSLIDQHYSGIVARMNREIQSLHDQLARLRTITDEIQDEDWVLYMPDTIEDGPGPYTIRYPLDDRPWPKKDGMDQ